jgi:hypothetical protein
VPCDKSSLVVFFMILFHSLFFHRCSNVYTPQNAEQMGTGKK